VVQIVLGQYEQIGIGKFKSSLVRVTPRASRNFALRAAGQGTNVRPNLDTTRQSLCLLAFAIKVFCLLLISSHQTEVSYFKSMRTL
jgi:hypothetical protein